MVFQAKVFIVLLVLTVFCVFSAITGKSNQPTELSPNGILAEILSNGTKRAHCSNTFGCSNQKCWADCIGVAGWCYTTKEIENGYGKYVACTEDHQCDRWWRCAGPCQNCSSE